MITGAGGTDTYGIRMSPAATNPVGIEIRNGTITNFWSAIYLANTSGVVVERVRAVRNPGYYGVFLGSNCVLNDNVATESGHPRQSSVRTSLGCVVSGNTASNNYGYGIFLEGGTAIGNVTDDNGPYGLVAGPGSTVANNSSRSNYSYGIAVACPANVVGNTATSNAGGNILFTGDGCGNNYNVSP